MVFKMYLSYLSTNQVYCPGSLKVPVDINALIELYFLAEKFKNEMLKEDVLYRIKEGNWTGVIVRESVIRVFEKLGGEDGLKGWVVRRLVGFWTGSEGDYWEGKEQDWSWVTEEMRENVLEALKRGDGGYGEVEITRVKLES